MEFVVFWVVFGLASLFSLLLVLLFGLINFTIIEKKNMGSKGFIFQLKIGLQGLFGENKEA